MPAFSLKLPRDLDARLSVAARRRRTTKSALVREAIESHLGGAAIAAEGSVLDLVHDLVGCVEGTGDLSYNPRRMRGFGR
jgi:ribbon-helix-helix CopG family protein